VIADIAPSARVVLLDIEGTTTPISFVHDTLFPFARARLDAFLAERWEAPEVQAAVSTLAAERPRESFPDQSSEMTPEVVSGFVRWLMDRDRKSPGLKDLQGLIWEDGYNAGLLHGAVWEDVPRAIGRWRASGLRVAIYSSGSELAQRLLFRSTPYGDLTTDIDAFFDTRMGGKLMAESYVRIARALSTSPAGVCFVSDVTGELKAARAAGCVTVLSLRSGNASQPEVDEFPQVTTFDDL